MSTQDTLPIEQEREKFEAWTKSRVGPFTPVALDRADAGNYLWLPAVNDWMVWQAAIAAQAQQPYAKWRLVPGEPTPEMVQAGERAHKAKERDMFSPTPTEFHDECGGPMGCAWLAMLAAAPQAEPVQAELTRRLAEAIEEVGLDASVKSGEVRRTAVRIQALLIECRNAIAAPQAEPQTPCQGCQTPRACQYNGCAAEHAAAEPEPEPLSDELLLAAQSAITCSYTDFGRRSVNLQAWDRLIQAVAVVTHGIGTKGGDK